MKINCNIGLWELFLDLMPIHVDFFRHEAVVIDKLTVVASFYVDAAGDIALIVTVLPNLMDSFQRVVGVHLSKYRILEGLLVL